MSAATDVRLLGSVIAPSTREQAAGAAAAESLGGGPFTQEQLARIHEISRHEMSKLLHDAKAKSEADKE